MPRRGPVRVAVEERAEDATVDDPLERLVVAVRPPLGDDEVRVVRIGVARDVEPVRVRGPQPEAAAGGGVELLETLGRSRGSGSVGVRQA